MKITVRTPLRLTLGGGGTDQPECYETHGGFVCAVTIDKYITVTIHPSHRLRTTVLANANGSLILNRVNAYSTSAGWSDRDLVEIESDVKEGSGLGGSGALMVSTLLARNPTASPDMIAGGAYHIEKLAMGRHTGWQDHYIAAYGGLRSFECDRRGFIRVHDAKPPMGLLGRLALFSTGIQRDAETVLSKQTAQMTTDNRQMWKIKQIGMEIADDLSRGGYNFGNLTRKHWDAKRESCSATTNAQLDEWCDIAIRSGADGVKVCGAGAGGYLLCHCPTNRQKLVDTLEAVGLSYTPFKFTNDKATIQDT